ncbi:hypothetical protein MNV49_001995 [Pseudohyphozyma bogoriensis]|nr:hypothetical protein MNV49_001995 [Pseudohyphozyma bogoriensis]
MINAVSLMNPAPPVPVPPPAPASDAPAPASLVLPPPPPPPPAAYPPPSAPLQRVASYAASIASSSQTVTNEEPTVDDLKRETFEIKTNVEEVISNLRELEVLRDAVIAAEDGGAGDLHKLTSLTTSTGQKILQLSGPLASVSGRAEILEGLAREGKTAATSIEVSHIVEELEVVKLEVKKTIGLVKTLAWDEVEGKELTKARIERRIRRENPTMNDDGVRMTVNQAMSGSSERIAQLDVLSYAGRVAAESPFTEIAMLLDTIQQLRSGGFSQTTTSFDGHSDTATLVDTNQYAKLDLDHPDLESAPFTEAGANATWVPGQKVVKAPFMVRLKKNWRDWLVRAFLVATVLSVIIGITAYETVQANNALNGNSTSTAAASATRRANVLHRL